MAEAPTPGNEVYIAPQQMQGFIDSINALNNAISQMAGRGAASPIDINSEDSDIEGEVPHLQQQQMQSFKRNAILRNPEYHAKVQQWIKAEVDSKIAQLQSLGIDKITVGDKTLSQQEIAEQAGKGDLGQQINSIILNKFQQTVDAQPGRFTRVLDAIESSGIRQLRFGQLPPQQILESAGKLMTDYSSYRAGRSIEAGRAPGRVVRGLGTFGEYVGVAGKALGTASVIGQVAKTAYDTTMGDYRGLTASGQLTGQGTLAGFEAKYTDPLKVWNPFGRLSFGQAREIVQSTREQGFTGPVAGRVEQGLANVVSNLGIQIGQATEFITQSMREGGMSVGQVTQEMNKFHDATFNLNMNINDYTQQIMDATSSLRSMGVGQAAPQLAQQITAALPRAYRNPEGTQFLTGAFEQSRGVLAGLVGHGANALNITSQRYAKAGWSAMDTLLEQQVQMARDQGYTTPNDIANFLSQVSPFFKGTDVNMLQQYITRMQHGRGLQAQMSMAHAAQAYSTRFAKSRTEVLRYNQMTPAELSAHNLRPLYTGMNGELTTSMNRRGQRPSFFENTVTGKRYSADAYRRVEGDTYNIKRADMAKHQLISSAERYHFLTHGQIETLKEANPRDVTSVLTQIMQRQSGNKVDVSTRVGTVTIELAKGAQGLVTLVKERQNANANGSIPANQNGK